jgi:ATP-binding cassette subfamily B protein
MPTSPPPSLSTTSALPITDLQLEQQLAQHHLDRVMWQRLWALIRPVKWLILALAMVEVVQVLSIFVRPWVIQLVLDHGLVLKATQIELQPTVLLWAMLLLIASWICRFAFAGLGKYLAGMTAIQVINQLRQRLFVHVQRLSMAYFDQTKAGRIISRADRDVDILQPLLIQGPPELLSAVLRCGLASLLLWCIYPPFFFTLLAIMPLLLGCSLCFKRISQRRWAKVAEQRSRFSAHLVETVNGVKIIQQMDYQHVNQQRYQVLLKEFNDAIIQGSVHSGWFAPLIGLLSLLGTAGLIVVGSYGYSTAQISLGEFAESIFYVFLCLAPMQDLTDLFDRYANGTACAQRIFLLLDTQSELREHPQAIELKHIEGAIGMQGVYFAYTRQPVLQDFNLEIAAGETVAIVGATGHGKSTVVQLLSRFYDVQQGQICIDQYPIQHISEASLRQHIGLVLQDNVLFSGTVLDNLRLIVPEASDAELIAAIETLGADDILLQLAQGYQTQVGSLGAHLSHGQRQLICLVRAYLHDPKILILDEATSAIDMFTEQKIQFALRNLCQNRSCIIIAHRLSTIQEADRIVVIDNGRVVEQGRHSELMAKGQHYYQLYAAYQQQQS